jgi:phosphatidylserine/phosphatidylglycerophosphate/cardiolipin synthase-like enzyme
VALRRKQELPAVSVDHDPWPQSLEPISRIAASASPRTAPGWGEAPAYAEGAVLTLDAAESAKHCIYIEAQYLTADFLARGLTRRSSALSGPEIVVS